jgi:hypothetical protein
MFLSIILVQEGEGDAFLLMKKGMSPYHVEGDKKPLPEPGFEKTLSLSKKLIISTGISYNFELFWTVLSKYTESTHLIQVSQFVMNDFSLKS